MKKFILLPLLTLTACGVTAEDVAKEATNQAIQSAKNETETARKQAVESMAKIPGLSNKAHAILADGKVSQEEYDQLVAASKQKAADHIKNLTL